MDAFGAAKAKWESVIVGDLPNTGGQGTSLCGTIPANVDDMYICGKAEAIDGPGNVLGSAGPSYVRPVNGNYLTSAGDMRFDTGDLNSLSSAALEAVIVHEMGHVMGIGTLWDYNNDLYTSGEFYKQNSKAQEKWNEIGCTGRLPVETDGGQGTAGGHWDEDCLQNEVMTGYLGESSGIFSAITIGTLEDLGYTVDYSAAEPFSISNLGTCKATYCAEATGNRRLIDEDNNLRGLGNQSGHGHDIFSSANNHGEGGIKRKKPLSPNGKADMKKYAAKEMKQLKNLPHEEHTVGGDIYVGGNLLIVMYVEDGEVYSETFTWDDVKDEED